MPTKKKATKKKAAKKKGASRASAKAFLVACPKINDVYRVLTGSTYGKPEGAKYGGYTYNVTIVKLPRSQSSESSQRLKR